MSIQTYAFADNLPAPTASSTTTSFTDVNGEIWVAKSTVNSGAWKLARDALHASVYRNAAWNTVAAFAAFGFDTVTSDPYGMWAGSASGYFVCPIAGWYRANFQAGIGMTQASMWFQIEPFAGPASATQLGLDGGFGCGLTSGNLFCRSTVLYYAAANDQIMFKHACNVAAVAGLTGSLNTHGSIEYCGAG